MNELQNRAPAGNRRSPPRDINYPQERKGVLPNVAFRSQNHQLKSQVNFRYSDRGWIGAGVPRHSFMGVRGVCSPGNMGLLVYFWRVTGETVPAGTHFLSPFK